MKRRSKDKERQRNRRLKHIEMEKQRDGETIISRQKWPRKRETDREKQRQTP